jgi:hypothetical protein
MTAQKSNMIRYICKLQSENCKQQSWKKITKPQNLRHCSWLIVHFQSPDEIHEADPGDFCYRSLSLQVPKNCLWCIRYRSWDDCWSTFAEGSQDSEGHSNRQHISEFSTLASKLKTPSEVTYQDQNNTAHTSGANHKPPSKLLTKIRTTQCTHLLQTNNPLRSYLQRWEEHSAHTNISLVEAPTIKYFCCCYYFCILEDARNHAYCCK